MNKIKRAIPVSALLAALLLAAILFSGCTDQVIPSSPEGKAKQLADNTTEGRIATTIEQAFANIDKCTTDELLGAMRAYYATQGITDMPEPTAEQMVQVEEVLAELRKCKLGMEKVVTKEAENEYLVSYSFVVPSGCTQTMPMAGTEDFLQVKANTAAETTEIVYGALDSEQRAQAEMMVQAMALMGNCGAAMMMAGATTSMATPV